MNQLALKLITIGDGGVGKTTLLHRYVEGNFVDTTTMTIGVEFLVKEIQIGDTLCQLNLWDISGQERFFFMVDKYMRGASGALLLFDITSMRSFVNLGKWVKIVREHNTLQEDIPIVLIAAKCDLEEFSMVGDVLAKKAQEKINLTDYIKTSSKSGLNVDLSIETLVKNILEKRES
ncbi:MAG: GTP-binding protein [Candidatus Lokiarchaeota archaeon]|nr:GTP-binding protein [Candidatus Lokiarchaeota archaeon]